MDILGLFTHDELVAQIDAGNVSVRPHPTDRLLIYNYTKIVQYNREWNNVTTNCRGLILSDLGIHARPFPKIFNYGELDTPTDCLDSKPIVNDKLDGSLGIIYLSSRGYEVATRGSFTSEQAIWATKWLNEHIPGFAQPNHVTTLVEIVYPENRICVNYGDRAELVLLAAIDNNTGEDLLLEDVVWWTGSVAAEHTDLEALDKIAEFARSEKYQDEEGVICTWRKAGAPSFRMKIKHPEYVRLHGIIYSFSEKKVWECMSEGGDFLALIEDVPDEFYDLVKSVVADLQNQYDLILAQLGDEWRILNESEIQSKKDFAFLIKDHPLKSLLFSQYDGKDYEAQIWKMIKPSSVTEEER